MADFSAFVDCTLAVTDILDDRISNTGLHISGNRICMILQHIALISHLVEPCKARSEWCSQPWLLPSRHGAQCEACSRPIQALHQSRCVR